MTDFFYEYELREQLRRLEAVDRRLERWGWFRRGETAREEAGLSFRAGTLLIRLGSWLQRGRGSPEGAQARQAVAGSPGPAGGTSE